MSGQGGPIDKLQALDEVEKNILSCLSSAGQALQELSKDKPSVKQMDLHTSHFLKTLNHVEIEMGKHINYLTQVSTGQAHEGSSYASQKVLQMAFHRSEHAKVKVNELDKGKSQFSVPRPFGMPGRGPPTPGSSSVPTPQFKQEPGTTPQ